jgi:hypothetical protein
MSACSRIDKCRIRRIWSCKRISDRRNRDFSVRSPTRKLPFRLRVQYSVKPTKFDKLGLGRFQSQAKLPQSLAQRLLAPESVCAILETHHKVVDVSY